MLVSGHIHQGRLSEDSEWNQIHKIAPPKLWTSLYGIAAAELHGANFYRDSVNRFVTSGGAFRGHRLDEFAQTSRELRPSHGVLCYQLHIVGDFDPDVPKFLQQRGLLCQIFLHDMNFARGKCTQTSCTFSKEMSDGRNHSDAWQTLSGSALQRGRPYGL